MSQKHWCNLLMRDKIWIWCCSCITVVVQHEIFKGRIFNIPSICDFSTPQKPQCFPSLSWYFSHPTLEWCSYIYVVWFIHVHHFTPHLHHIHLTTSSTENSYLELMWSSHSLIVRQKMPLLVILLVIFLFSLSSLRQELYFPSMQGAHFVIRGYTRWVCADISNLRSVCTGKTK